MVQSGLKKTKKDNQSHDSALSQLIIWENKQEQCYFVSYKLLLQPLERLVCELTHVLIHVTIVRAYIRAPTDIQQSAELTEELGGNYRFSQFPEQIN